MLSGRGNVHADDNGNSVRMSGTGQDVTEIKRAEAVILAAKQSAEESSMLKEVFLANMSHEIRTPLNAIIGFTDILQKSDIGEQEREYLDMIKKAGENLSAIINDILEISKIEAGMIDFEKRPLSVKEILKSLNAMLAQKAKEKNIELVFECNNNVPDILLGDPTRLTQILINLIGNAIKFTPKGRVEVFVKLLKSENERYLLEFLIKDTGIGISKDKLQYIFQRFRQAESNTTRKYGGSGLGLSISEQLIKLQGGEITVKSLPNVGSTFIFTLPYTKTTETLSVFEERQEIFFDIKEVRKLKILLAEDNDLNIKLILTLFSKNGLKLEIAENGKIAVEMIQNNEYDVVLMDMEMPEMNGYEATKIIRDELKNNIPIIAMTAHAMAGEREKCLQLGMNDYISKPINVNLLFSKIYNITCGETLSHEKTGLVEFKSPPTSTEKVSNLSYLIQTVDGDKEAIKDVINLFLQQIQEDLCSLNDAIMKTDYANIKGMTHKMNSSTSMMGISILHPILERMEHLGRMALGIEELKQLNEQVNALYKQAIEEIKIEKLKYI